MKDNQLYQGFSPEKQAEHEAWLTERSPGMRAHIETSREAWAKSGDAGRQAQMAELAELESGLASLLRVGEPPESEAAEELLERHRAWVAAMWNRPCPPEAHAGLADIYASHPGFRERYEAIEPGFTDWLADAIRAHAAR
ncbi:MAG: TipAS antibiotic-recognition domain-containing protein [Sphingomonas sp.]